MKRFSCFLLLGLCLFPHVVLCQSTNATISGGVTDPSGNFIPDAAVGIANDATGTMYSVRTNTSGMYFVPILPPGHYHVQVSKLGFKTIIKPDVILNVQSAMALNFVLPVGATSESITVEAGSSMLNTADASVSTVIDRKFVENIPLNGRSFQDLISMTPGVVTQSPQSTYFIGYQGDFSVNGQRTESNYYTVDGVSANNGAGNGGGLPQAGNTGTIAASTALGTTQSVVSVDALEEFRVSSSTYSAEYGRSPGGQFSFTTRSGTDVPHGSVYEYLRNNVFDANDWFNKHNGKPQTALRQNDFGGTFGAPIRIPRVYNGINKSFFFVSYEGLRLVQPTAATTQYVPSLAVRTSAPAALQPIFNAFPVPTGAEIALSSGALSGLSPFVASYSLPSGIDSTSVRLDHHFGQKLSVFFRFADTPTYTQSRTLSSVTRTSIGTTAYTVGATSQFSPRLSNEVRLGISRSTSALNTSLDSFGGATPVDLNGAFGIPGTYVNAAPEPYLNITGVGTSYVYAGTSSNKLSQWNLTDTFSVTVGHHAVRTGFDLRHIQADNAPIAAAVYGYFYSRQQMTTNQTNSAQITKRIANSPVIREFAAFVQDDWRIRPNLSISSGVRWDVNPAPTGANGQDAYTLRGNVSQPSTLTLAPRGTRLWDTAWFILAPRLGAAWTVHNTSGHETVFRAGVGVFFDTGTQVATGGFQGIGFVASKSYTGASLPLSDSQFAFSTDPVAPYTSAVAYVFPTHLQPPYTLQWNVSAQQALGKDQAITVSYVAAAGKRLLQNQLLSVNSQNANFNQVLYFPGGVISSYQALQLQFQRAVPHGLQALASYTWSHSLDDGSSSSSFPFTYGNSTFDVRHNFQGGLSWDVPKATTGHLLGIAINDWALDGRLIARTAFPVTLTGNTLTDSSGSLYYSGVNYDSSKPVYLYGSQYPGGRIVNGGPLASAPAFTLPTGKSSGNAPRNFVRGFDAIQVNAALRKEFHPTDHIQVQFRAEAFNLLNHPIFGYVNPSLTNALFGQTTMMLNQSLGTMSALYQQGGYRSMQFALRLKF